MQIAPEVRQQVIEWYQRGEDQMAVARRFGISQRSVYNFLQAAGIKTRNLEETTRNPHHIHDFFSVINTDAKAWALGLLASDGNVTGNSNCIRLSLKADDADAVGKVRDLACPTAAVVRRLCRDSRSGKQVEYAILAWCSKRGKEDLIRHGVTPAKSKTLLPWNGPHELMPAYWRGMLDGDGSWVRCLRKGRKSWTCTLSLTGTKAVTEGFREFVRQRTGNTPSLVPSRTAWLCMVGSMTALDVLVPILYGNATVWLNRKRLLAEQILARGT